MSGEGSIVNVSSVNGVAGFQRMAAYSASEGALDALTRALAIEWAARGIRVNSVVPRDDRRSVRPPKSSQEILLRVPLGRLARPEGIVPAILFLAGPLASYVTGTSLFVDGGWTAQ
jgi:NAD(P)-dependent dehydrogenase (short-subunit alcohol dehydrogenase family)